MDLRDSAANNSNIGAPKFDRRKLPAVDLAAAIIAIAGIFARPSTAGDPGVGWHLKTGEWILSHHTVPHHDLFLQGTLLSASSTAQAAAMSEIATQSAAGRLWVANQWLADLFFHCLYQLGGFSLLHLFTVILFVSSHCILPGQILQRTKVRAIPLFLALLIGALVGSVQWILRPVLFGFLCFAAAVAHASAIAERDPTNNRPTLTWKDIFFAIGLFLLWSNLHSTFALGWMVYALALFLPLLQARASAFSRELAHRVGFLLVIGLATLINPYGSALHHNMFELLHSHYFMQLNKEWISPDFHLPEFSRIAIIWALMCLGALLGYAREVRPFEAILTTALIFLSLQSRRYLPFCAIPLTIVIARQLDALVSDRLAGIRLLANWRDSDRTIPVLTAILLATTMLFVVTTDHLPLRRAEDFSLDAHYPARVLDPLDAVKDTGRAIFHSPDFGGYITWRFFPRIRPFIDDRNELNGEQAYRDYFTVVRMEPGWQQLIETKKFEWLLLEKTTALAKYLQAAGQSDGFRSRWKRLAEDEKVVLYELVTTPTALNALTTE